MKNAENIQENMQESMQGKQPLQETQVNFLYTKGIYQWFTKSCLKLFLVVVSILSTIKDAYTDAEYTALVKCLWIVNHMKRKLEGICSISSSVHDNKLCKARMALKNCICKYCYAAAQQKYQNGLREHNTVNGLILRNVLIPVKFFRALMIVFPYLRIESFGDVENVIQARNYIRIIKAFPEKRCAIWSKNLLIWEKAFAEEGKPENTTFVFSSSELNKPAEFDRKRFWFVDHRFTVYTKDFVKKHGIVINCGGKKCLKCILEKINCYFRNTEFDIRELKK